MVSSGQALQQQQKSRCSNEQLFWPSLARCQVGSHTWMGKGKAAFRPTSCSSSHMPSAQSVYATNDRQRMLGEWVAAQKGKTAWKCLCLSNGNIANCHPFLGSRGGYWQRKNGDCTYRIICDSVKRISDTATSNPTKEKQRRVFQVG